MLYWYNYINQGLLLRTTWLTKLFEEDWKKIMIWFDSKVTYKSIIPIEEEKEGKNTKPDFRVNDWGLPDL